MSRVADAMKEEFDVLIQAVDKLQADRDKWKARANCLERVEKELEADKASLKEKLSLYIGGWPSLEQRIEELEAERNDYKNRWEKTGCTRHHAMETAIALNEKKDKRIEALKEEIVCLTTNTPLNERLITQRRTIVAQQAKLEAVAKLPEKWRPLGIGYLGEYENALVKCANELEAALQEQEDA